MFAVVRILSLFKLCHYWFKSWLGTCSMPSRYPSAVDLLFMIDHIILFIRDTLIWYIGVSVAYYSAPSYCLDQCWLILTSPMMTRASHYNSIWIRKGYFMFLGIKYRTMISFMEYKPSLRHIFRSTWVTLSLTWINFNPSMWDEITHPFPNFNSAALQ